MRLVGASDFKKLETTVTNPSVYPTATVNTPIAHGLGKMPIEWLVYAGDLAGTIIGGPYSPAHPVNNGAWLAVNVRNIWVDTTNITIQWGWIEVLTPNAQFKFIVYIK